MVIEQNVMYTVFKEVCLRLATVRIWMIRKAYKTDPEVNALPRLRQLKPDLWKKTCFTTTA